MKVKVQTLGNKKYEFELNPSDTIEVVKQKVMEKAREEGTEGCWRVRIMSGKRTLADEQTVEQEVKGEETLVAILSKQRTNASPSPARPIVDECERGRERERQRSFGDLGDVDKESYGHQSRQRTLSGTEDEKSTSVPPSPPHPNESSPAPSSPSAPSSPGAPALVLPPQAIADLTAQVRATMERAFFDTIRDRLTRNPPDFEWVVRLYQELRDRLCAITPRRTDLRNEIHEHMDVDFFNQMLRSGVYDVRRVHALVHFVFDRIMALEAPTRNESTQGKVAELDSHLQQSTVVLGEFVPLFLRAAHFKLDELEEDIRAFRAQMLRRQQQQSSHTASPSSQPPR